MRSILRALTIVALLLIVMFLPLIQITHVYIYTTIYPDGRVETDRESWTEWVSLYDYVLGGFRLPRILAGPEKEMSLKDLEDALRRVRFRERFNRGLSALFCDEKCAVIMKYLHELGFDVEMGRGKLQWGEEGAPHGWVLVHLGGKTYVVEASGQTGSPYVVGTVQEAERGPMSYKEETRWSMEKVEEEFKDLLKEGVEHYLEMEK